MEVWGNNRSVMPLDVLGRTRATLMKSTSFHPWSEGPGNLLKLHRAGDSPLQFLDLNEEFLVSVSHQLALITSLPFVHTARRYYRLNGLVNPSDWLFFLATEFNRWKVGQTWSFRGSKSRNKVSVGEPAEGSLINGSGFLEQLNHPTLCEFCLYWNNFFFFWKNYWLSFPCWIWKYFGYFSQVFFFLDSQGDGQ